MKIRKAEGTDPDDIEKIGIAGYVLNGTSDVQPAIPFFEKNPERRTCVMPARDAGARRARGSRKSPVRFQFRSRAGF